MIVLPATAERPTLTTALRHAFAPVDIARGDELVRTVVGSIDSGGGVVADVGSLPCCHGVQLMPSPRDRRLLLAACSCDPGGSTCEHVWAVVQAVTRHGAWPDGIAVPERIAMTDAANADFDQLFDSDEIVDIDGAALGAPARSLVHHALYPFVPAAHWRARVGTWPSTVRVPPTGRVLRIEYVVEAVPADWLRVQRAALPDPRAVVVLVAQPMANKTGAVRRRYGNVDVAKLGTEDRAIMNALFSIEELEEQTPLSSEAAPHLRRLGGKRSGARIDRERIAEAFALIGATGRLGWIPDSRGAEFVPLAWDGGGAWTLAIEARRGAHRTVRLTGTLVRGDAKISIDDVTAITGGGLAIEGDRLLQVATDNLANWVRLLAGGLEVPVAELADLLNATCQLEHAPSLDVSEIGWTVVEPTPERRVVISTRGRHGFEARAELLYDGEHADPSSPARVLDAGSQQIVRRRYAEERAASLELRDLGGRWTPWPVAAGDLRDLVGRFADKGWDVYYQGSRVRTGSFEMAVTTGIDWFDLQVTCTADADCDAALAMPELLRALRAGHAFVRLSDGTTATIPKWLEARAAILLAAQDGGATVRFRRSETLLVAELVDQVPGASADAAFRELRERLDRVTALAPRSAPRGFGAKLRDYQRDGLGWLLFLRELGLGGCLADDMGLGKTVQVLALLEGLRRAPGTAGARRPSLVVAPKSLVFHWIDEARRFAPKLCTLEWHGARRSERAEQLAHADVIVTTYATLRQDLERLRALELDVVILDEAHAIKTATTATAKAVRSLRSDHRLALTGTPVENRLDELASIFEFLNPGLLGRPAVLRAIASRDSFSASSGDPHELELAQARALGRVLRPFMLRRTKEEVLRELPAKSEQVIACRLEGVERKRYDELRDYYRRALLPRVEREGVGKQAIVVLEALLRLRQAALHPGLLDPEQAGEDSAKLEALVCHLRTAIGSGHRALVFSQFTTLLDIVRQRLAREGIGYQYLDGQTVDRRERVAAFQAGSHDVFLLSLKAGGTGLNLTAADHVFLLDPWWNPAVEAQAIDRVHRIGQDRPVVAYRLVAEDTVEAKILALQAHKRALFANVFDDHGVIANLKVDELRALLE